MKPTHQGQVRWLGLTAVGPVANVVCVKMAHVATTRETATAVASIERTTQGWRDGSGFAAHVERLALIVFDQSDYAGVTGEATRGLGGDGGAMLDLATTGRLVTQRFGGDMNYDLMKVAVHGFPAVCH